LTLDFQQSYNDRIIPYQNNERKSESSKLQTQNGMRKTREKQRLGEGKGPRVKQDEEAGGK
jgi:hypothetical protein